MDHLPVVEEEPAEEGLLVQPPMTTGQWPDTVYAILQKGTFLDGRAHTFIQYATTKAQLDMGAEAIRKYGDPTKVYRARIGHITWEAEVDIVPDAADAQLDIFGTAQPLKRKGKK